MANINNNPNSERSYSQKARILRHLQNGWKLTPRDAILQYGCTRLAARIWELINDDGHTEIKKEMITVLTADGKKTRVMQYSIPEPTLFNE